MAKFALPGSHRFPWRNLCAATLLLGVTALNAPALYFDAGDAEIRIDTTISAGVAHRINGPDPEYYGIAAGGFQASVNADDGNLNFDSGIYSRTVKFTTDVLVDFGDFGGFARVTGFYDHEIMDDARARRPLSEEAKEEVGEDLDFLDYYIYWLFDVGNVLGELRVGNQVLSWGESTFILNSINAINPIDVSRFRLPGSEIKEALVPVPMVYGSLVLTDALSVEAFYQLRYEETIIDPPGTYFSTSDFVGPGGDRVMLGFGTVPDATPLGFGARVPRGETDYADDDGQWGIATRVFLDNLNATELGFYFINYHSRIPVISALTGSLAAAAAPDLDYVASARYLVEYPEDIRLYGASFNTSWRGISFQGEVSYRENVPLQLDDIELLYAALAAPAALAPAGVPPEMLPPALRPLVFLRDNNQILRGENPGFESRIQGWRELDVWQAQMTATKIFGPTFGASQWVLLGEIGMTHVPDLPDPNVLRFDGTATFTAGGGAATAAGIQPYTTPADQFPDETSYGVRVVTRWDYLNVGGSAWNMSPRAAFAWDIDGNTPLPLGVFLDGRKSLTLGVDFDYQQKWSTSVSYTNFFGGGVNNLLQDRDFVSFDVKYSF